VGTLGGSRETASVGDGAEVAELVEFHGLKLEAAHSFP
jgi:hypothetical protein